ncbi:MAG: hypothetical protein KBT12_02300 [Bacteroidales bacterium]|nr:hypothetical protein [Candidatus Physcousia equi]
MINTIQLFFDAKSSDATTTPVVIANKRTDSIIQIDNVNLLAHIASLQYNKELYAPCRIEADIVLLSQGTASQDGTTRKLPSVTELRNFFDGRTVTFCLTEMTTEALPDATKDVATDATKGVTTTDTKPTASIGKNFQVFNLVPRITRAGGSQVCYVHLTLFSMDYLLTLEKYCHTYTGQKLGAHILTDKMSKTTGLGSSMLAYSADQLVITKYCPDTAGSWKEFRHPYLVQYNESFYDFLARTCNRCGEFLFFEDGKLTLGLPDNVHKTTQVNDNGTSSEMSYYTIDPDLVLSISYPILLGTEKFADGTYYDYMAHDTNTYSKGDEYDWNMAGDEYFEELNTDGPDTFLWGEFAWGAKVKAIINNLPMSMTNLRAWSQSISKVVTDLGLIATKESLAAKYCNDDFKKAVVESEAAGKNSDYYDESEQKQSNKMYQFASLPPDNTSYISNTTYKNLSSLLFQFVRGKQNEAAQSAIELELMVTPELADLRLGERICLDNNTYVIIQVRGSFCQTHEGVTESLQLLAIPYSDHLIVPPAYKLADPPKASAQPAFVVDNADPQYMGRVRIKFPWQGKEEKASPWVRMAMPMASKKGGFFARPEKGDEVLVDFRNGDMQHPVVIGALYRGDTPTPHLYKYSYGRMASTKWQNNCGQQIILENGKPQDLVLSFFPSLSYVAGMFPGSWVSTAFDSTIGCVNVAKEMLSKLSGGITLSDCFGLTSITTNTAKRSVIIDSMMGQVTISAMTGINISAPHGDVTIEGKNVTIKALNNVKIESGVAIKNEIQKFAFEKKVGALSKAAVFGAGVLGGAASTIIEKVNTFVDMKLIRCFWEIYLDPKEGTLLLKSHRYLQMEAGKGKTSDTSTGFLSAMENDPVMELTVALKLISKRIRSEFRTAYAQYKKICEKAINLKMLIADALAYDVTPSCHDGSENLTACVKKVLKKIYKENKYSVSFKFGDKEYANAKKFISSKEGKNVVSPSHTQLKNWHKTYETTLEELYALVRALPLSQSPKALIRKFYISKNEDFFALSAGTGFIPESVRAKYRKTLGDLLEDHFKKIHILPDDDDFSFYGAVTEKDITNTVNEVTRRAYFRLIDAVDFVDSDQIYGEDSAIKNNIWASYVGSLYLSEGKRPGATDIFDLGKAVGGFKKNSKFWNHNNEATRWTPEQTGRIMMSDNPRSTLVLSDDGVWERKENGMAAIKAILEAAPQLADVVAPDEDENEDGNEEVIGEE